MSVRRSCLSTGLSRAAYYRTPVVASDRDADIITALNALIKQHPRWGFWMCRKALRRKGYPWNHKRVYRVYCALRLNLKRRAKRRLPERIKQPLLAPEQPNKVWSGICQ